MTAKTLIKIAFVLLFLSGCTQAPEQVISADPRGFLLQLADLPVGVTYYMPENEAFLIPNETAIGAFGQEKGQALLDDTQRVTSARVHFQRNDAKKAAPEYYVVTVTLHQSAKGAQTVLEKYNVASLFPDGGWTVEDTKITMGDKAIVETGTTADPSGKRAINYRIEFTYRNASVDVLVCGLEKEVNLDTAAQAARYVLDRLKAAPLSKAPLAIPTIEIK
jgi:hypothetical protein